MEEKKEGKKEEEKVEQGVVTFSDPRARLIVLMGDVNEATRGAKEEIDP